MFFKDELDLRIEKRSDFLKPRVIFLIIKALVSFVWGMIKEAAKQGYEYIPYNWRIPIKMCLIMCVVLSLSLLLSTLLGM